MLEVKLFLGFFPDDAFFTELKKANPYLVSLFVGKEDYLQDIVYDGKRCFGKQLELMPTTCQIEDVEKHLLSLLARLAPKYNFSHNTPLLLTMV